MALNTKKYSVGSLIVAKDTYVYGAEEPINRMYESHSIGHSGCKGDFYVVLGHFKVKNENIREAGLKVWSFRENKIVWIYEQLLRYFKVVDDLHL